MEPLHNADLVMSLDNVIAAAAAAKGSMWVLVLGSTLMIRLMERFPVIVVLGAALIGWVGGETIMGDTALNEFVASTGWLHFVAAPVGAVLVVGLGKLLRPRNRKA